MTQTGTAADATEMVTNETDDPNETRSEIPLAEAEARAAAATQRDGRADPSSEARQAEYVHVGMAFLAWFNEKLGLLPNAQIRLGTKTAQAVRLHPDGRLECSLAAAAGEEEQTFVAFEGQYLDQLVRKIAAISV